jgi:hypothetical protein
MSYSPDNRSLNHIFTILINSFKHIARLSLNFGLNRQVEINTDLLGFKTLARRTSFLLDPRIVISDTRHTGIQIILLLLLVDKQLGFHKQTQNLTQEVLGYRSGGYEFIQR